MKRQLIFGHLISLALGLLIYLFFRTSTLKMFDWFGTIGLGNFVVKLRQTTLPIADILPDWILFSVPDGMWVFSYVCLMLFIWQNTVSKSNIIWILVIPILAICSEIGQLMKIVPGVFDVVDLLTYYCGAILPFIIYRPIVSLKFRAA